VILCHLEVVDVEAIAGVELDLLQIRLLASWLWILFSKGLNRETMSIAIFKLVLCGAIVNPFAYLTMKLDFFDELLLSFLSPFPFLISFSPIKELNFWQLDHLIHK
jgi:hypothetical protein